ncbi:MAG: uroporphyrinogen-III C-methyltransferase [Thiotrichales bacterium]
MNDPSQQTPVDEVATNDENDGQPTRPRARSGRFTTVLAVLALLLGLSLMGVGAYAYRHVIQPLQQLSDGMQSQHAESELNHQTALADLQGKLDTLAQQLNQTHDQVINAESRFQGYETQLDQIRGQAHWSQREWVLAEIAYLLQVGEARLRYMRDADTAQTAARNALMRLDQIADPALAPLRQQLQRDLRILQQYRKPDPAALLAPIEAQINALKPLPSAAARSDAASAYAAADAEAAAAQAPSATDAWYTRAAAAVTSRVRVIHHDSALNAIARETVDQQAYQLLRLRLESLRLAILQDDEDVFQRELGAMMQWVGGLLEEKTAQPILDVLRGLRERGPFPDLPSLQGTIDRFTAVISASSQTEEASNTASEATSQGSAK